MTAVGVCLELRVPQPLVDASGQGCEGQADQGVNPEKTEKAGGKPDLLEVIVEEQCSGIQCEEASG